MKITAIIIAKNEEDVIENAIKSVSFCDEVLVVNNSSADKTVDVSKKLGARIIDKKSDDFSDLRNFGMDNSHNELILYIDADEVVTSELKESIQTVVSLSESDSAYILRRKNYYLGKNEWPGFELMPRLFLKKELKGWKGKIHESPVFNGDSKELNGFLLHFTHRNLSQMLQKTIEWSDIEAMTRFEANHPKMIWWRFPRVMISSFFNSYIKQKGYKVGGAGLIEGIYQSYSTFITYAKLWELQKKS